MILLVVIFVLIFGYGYMNGHVVSATIVSSVVSSHAMNIREAFWLAAISMFLGPFLLGTAVANTIGAQLIAPQAATLPVIGAALIGTILWSSITLWLKIPVSISQALVGGLVGASWISFGHEAILQAGMIKALLGLFLSPILGLVVSYLVTKLSYRALAHASPRLNLWLKRSQIVLSILLALTLSANDSQKIMGVIILCLIASGYMKEFAVPPWVISVQRRLNWIGVAGRQQAIDSYHW